MVAAFVRVVQVFMEMQRTTEGKLQPLEKKNIDTGLGLERMAQILQVRWRDLERNCFAACLPGSGFCLVCTAAIKKARRQI